MRTKYTVKLTGRFKKDYKLAIKQGMDITLLDNIITLLAKGEGLPARYRDHSLGGNWSGHRECHIQADWLLIYSIKDDILVLTLSRTGTHNELFRK